MDFSPLKKSFKSQGSYKHARKISGGGATASSHSNEHEELPILGNDHDHDHQESPPEQSPRAVRSTDRGRAEVIVKVDSGHSSFDSKTPRGNIDDPPSKLIGQFLNKQKNAGGEIALDMDMEMDELRREYYDRNLHPFPESPLNSTPSKEIRVSFDPSLSGGISGALSGGIESTSADTVRKRYKDLIEGKDGHHNHNHNHKQQPSRDEVLKCTSNASFRAQPNQISRLKTKSRLLDPSPEELARMSGRLPPKSGPLKSGLLGRASKADDDDDDDDPLAGDDMPEEYHRKSFRLSAMNIIQWVSLIAITGALICTLALSDLREKHFLKLPLWKWEVLALVLICGRLVSGWGIRIIVFFIERNFLLRKRVLYFVYGLRKGVQNCWWLGLVLLAWHFLFDEKVRRESEGNYLMYINKILVCFMVANFMWLLKTLMVKVLASSFHVSTYFDRIQESIFNQFVIETLSGPPLIELQRNEDEIEKTAAEIRILQNAGVNMAQELKDSAFKKGEAKSFSFSRQISRKCETKSSDHYGITIDYLHKLNPKNISAWNMKRLMNIVRHGSLSTLDEQILDAGFDDESGTEIRNEYEAKAAARKIFYNVAKNGSKYIYLQDLMRFMREDEASKSMSCFEGTSESSRISKSSLKNWVVNAFRERRALALTLNDTKTAVNKLHHVVNVVVSIIIIVIWLLILGIATSKFVVFIGSQIVVASFIFGNTVKTLFESILFLFLIHPFDVGDRCEVDSVQMIVEEMNILTTVFLRADNQKIVYPNNVLATKPIGNFYRSPDMGDAVEFFIHVSTPAEKIALMRQKIINYIETKKEHWYPGPMVVMKELEELNQVRVAVWLRHRINHQDMGERFSRRSLLLEEMVKIFKDVDMQFRLLPLDVNIRTIPPFNS
ncbi:mechanosensitive ion channel protein 6-like [Mercurialis annua]|uniref:mechanosensitive ion channel protein 6-like n=1 Tax=Mercurialis annua TaxID=3986 RepID=UPI00215E7F63|nr:mechanosensitive ion channel protein 6-like [Mercurialis annua]